jgi:hypothetical protein
MDQERAIDEFAETAKEYCRLIEEYRSTKVPAFLATVESLLPLLYLSALALPNVEPSRSEQESAADAGRLNELHDGLRKFLRDYDLYYTVLDPVDREDHEPVAGTLAGDLAEIHTDLQEGLAYWRSASTSGKADAAWDWKFGFESHWGRHLTRAISVLYSLIHEHYIAAAEDTERMA